MSAHTAVQTAVRDAQFLGRETELTLLQQSVELASHGEGGLVYLEAESGIGKSRLLQELAGRTAAMPTAFFWGQGADRVAQRPFEIFQGVISGIIARAEQDAAFGERVQTCFTEKAEVLARIFPALSGILPGGTDSDYGPESGGQERSLRALTALLDSLGSPGSPAVVVLDDCQWADEPSLRLLSQWQRFGSRSVGCTLLIASYRHDEIRTESVLQQVNPSVRLRLGPLAAMDLALLVESMIGRVSSDSLQLIRKLSGENLFMVTAVVRGLVEAGLLKRGPQQWQVAAENEQDAEVIQQEANRFLRRRLELLPDTMLRLLQAGAILGREFEVSLLPVMTNLDPAALSSGLEDVVLRQILSPAAGERYTFVHDKLRETLLAMLSEERRRYWHRQAAYAIADNNPNRVFELAYHFDAADLPEQGLPYALRAAEEARTQQALLTAEEQYRIAKRGLSAVDIKLSFKVTQGLGEVLVGRGCYREAEEQLRLALTLAETKLEKAQIYDYLAELHMRCSEIRAAIEALESGLRLFGEKLPESSLLIYLGILRGAVTQVLHTLLPSFFCGTLPHPGEAESFTMKLYLRYDYALYFKCEIIKGCNSHLRALNRLELYSYSRELAYIYSSHCVLCSILGWKKRSRRYGNWAAEISRSLGHNWGVANAQHFLGVGEYSASNYRQALELLLSADRLQDRIGDLWVQYMLQCNVGLSLYRLGNLSESIRVNEQVVIGALKSGNYQSAASALSGWSKACGGDLPKAVFAQFAALPAELDFQSESELTQAEAISLLREGRADEAVTKLEQAWKMIWSRLVMQDYVLGTLPWLLTAMRLQRRQCRRQGQDIRVKQRRAARMGWIAELICRRFRNNLPQVLRERALLAWEQGRRSHARRKLLASIKESERQHAQFEKYLSSYLWTAWGCGDVKQLLRDGVLTEPIDHQDYQPFFLDDTT